MPRAKRRPLPIVERRKLAVGVFRHFAEGDDVRTVARRMGLPARRVHEALDEPIDAVRAVMGRGVSAIDASKECGLPVPFVKYVMRLTNVRRDQLVDRDDRSIVRRDRRQRRENPARGQAPAIEGVKELKGPVPPEVIVDFSYLLEDL